MVVLCAQIKLDTAPGVSIEAANVYGVSCYVVMVAGHVVV
jgi:hypothetical protein